ncbi:HpcH/HpaI aldolase/citrate lyase family protein [Solirhodobacter olei]|uniref:HpcH/HpaI aldolase/citrate lyase family protein n=1 Tax=Solirhodobacter olei TaxID=2493082 RepID=UPI000FDB13F8|nr:CoA ester lyase [Solirhodobacter olei]
MDPHARPWRSVLYIPASRQRALEKAQMLACDGIIFDLEDAVAPEEKASARAFLADALPQMDFGRRARIVRINGFDTEWGAADAALMARAAPDAVLIPKVGSAADVQAVAEVLPKVPLWAMIETPKGVLNAAEIAAHPRMQGFVLGTNDLTKDLGCRARPDRMPLMTSLQLALLAARAEGRICLDGVYNAFKDDAGTAAECAQGRDMGFDGKTVIHPRQIEIANRAFAPGAEELDLARRQIAAFEAARAAGQGVAVLDGRIVENLHVATAERLLARAEAIAAMEAAVAEQVLKAS